jgi:hypothetical protein
MDTFNSSGGKGVEGSKNSLPVCPFKKATAYLVSYEVEWLENRAVKNSRFPQVLLRNFQLELENCTITFAPW